MPALIELVGKASHELVVQFNAQCANIAIWGIHKLLDGYSELVPEFLLVELDESSVEGPQGGWSRSGLGVEIFEVGSGAHCRCSVGR